MTVRPPTEAALLLLLGMDCHFLSFHLLNQLANPFCQQLIGHPLDQPPIVRDLPVEFLALITHWRYRIRAKRCPPRGLPSRQFVQSIELGHFKIQLRQLGLNTDDTDNTPPSQSPDLALFEVASGRCHPAAAPVAGQDWPCALTQWQTPQVVAIHREHVEGAKLDLFVVVH
jgi:hypothetical protein